MSPHEGEAPGVWGPHAHVWVWSPHTSDRRPRRSPLQAEADARQEPRALRTRHLMEGLGPGPDAPGAMNGDGEQGGRSERPQDQGSHRNGSSLEEGQGTTKENV